MVKKSEPVTSKPDKMERLFSKEQLLAAERFHLMSNTRLKPLNR